MRGMSSEPECTAEADQAVDSDDDYATELHLAVKENDVPAIRKLLERGAKVNPSDKFGRTPLHWALVYGHQEASRALIINTSKRALDTRDSCGCTALHYAALGGRTEVGRILIERGAQVNSLDSRQRTPLHLAAQHPKPAMVEMLISRGADKSCRDFREYLPCDVALEWASFSSLACLRLDSQKKDPKLKVHPVEIVDEQDGGAVAPVEVAVRHGPSLDKLLESWKNAENEARRKKEAESEVAARAFAEVQRRLQEWKAAEKYARLRQRGGSSPVFGPISVDDNGNDAHSQVQDNFSEAVSSPRVDPSTAGAFSSLPSCSQPGSSLRASAVRDSSSSVECTDDEPYSSLSSSLFPSASSTCQGDPCSPRNLHDWLDSSGYSRKVCPKEARLWCTEWEVELPHRSTRSDQYICQEEALDTPPTSPRERKGKAKTVPEEEPLWPNPSPFPYFSSSPISDGYCHLILSPSPIQLISY